MNVVRHLVFHGRVQGVGFRAFVEDTAVGLSLKGWVRNRRDGTVEAVLEGPEDKVSAGMAACRIGPRGANVTRVDVEDGDPGLVEMREGARFSVLETK